MPLFLAFPALTGRVLGRHSVWGKEGILPPAPPRLVRPCFAVVADSSVKQGASRIRRDRTRPTGGAQPPSSFPLQSLWCRFRFESLTASAYDGAHPFVTDALAEMPEAESEDTVLAPEARVSTRRASSHPMRRAQTPAVRHPRGTAGLPCRKPTLPTAHIEAK